MAKVITLARTFMKDHPRAGEPTYFVEKVLNSLGIEFWKDEYFDLLINLNPEKWQKVSKFFYSLNNQEVSEKPHTIRNGHRFKQGDMASLRVWSGKPYNSPQIIIAPDVEIKKVYDFEIRRHHTYGYAPYINKCLISPDRIHEVSENDGLNYPDFQDWFKWGKQEFHGQIICWGEVDY